MNKSGLNEINGLSHVEREQHRVRYITVCIVNHIFGWITREGNSKKKFIEECQFNDLKFNRIVELKHNLSLEDISKISIIIGKPMLLGILTSTEEE